MRIFDRIEVALNAGLTSFSDQNKRRSVVRMAITKLEDNLSDNFMIGVYWHSGWDDEAGFSAIYMKVPDRKLSLILLANGEGLWWNNPLDQAMLEKSEFADIFMKVFVFNR